VRDFIRQLQERHVLRTAVLYLGAGWVGLEFIGFVVENYGFQRAVLDCSLLMIGVGLPIALIISWYHGAGGRQNVPRSEGLMVGGLILVGLIGSGLILSGDRPEPRSPTLAPAGIVADLGAGSVAVLPLANRTGADSLDWLGPGLADMLTTNLAQLDGLRVVSAQRLLDLLRQAGRQETEAIPDDLALQIAAQSGARTLVRGSFMAVGDEVRLDVQLIDLEDGTIAAAEQSRGSDVFALVDDVSARLSGKMLGASFRPTELTPVTQLATDNLEAYREYQQGLLAERRFLNEQGLVHYRRAVELDPTFAIAWLRLGMLADTQQERLAALQQADLHKAKATDRDRYMIEAMFAVNTVGNFETADSLLMEMIERYPEEKEARYQLGVFYDATDRDDEARAVIEEAVTLDPFYAPGINHLAYLAGRRGDSIGADTLSRRYLELEPGQANPLDSRGEILEMIGRHEDAREAFREALAVEPGFLASYEHLVRSYLREGDSEGARAALAGYMSTTNPDAAVWVRRLEGDAYVAEGRFRDGLAASRRAADVALRLDRDGPRLAALLDAGGLASLTGAFTEAERAYFEANEMDSLNLGILFGLIAIYGMQEKTAEFPAWRDSLIARASRGPAFVQQRLDLLLELTDGVIAFWEGDHEAAVLLFDQARERSDTPRPAMITGGVEEIIALIEVGRAEEALPLTYTLERGATTGNRYVPLPRQAALYLRGRAHQALDQWGPAAESYAALLEVIGDGAQETWLFRDTPDRLAAVRRSGTPAS
jgi:tetratricopeptide (TPR) repeat protein